MQSSPSFIRHKCRVSRHPQQAEMRPPSPWPWRSCFRMAAGWDQAQWLGARSRLCARSPFTAAVQPYLSHTEQDACNRAHFMQKEGTCVPSDARHPLPALACGAAPAGWAAGSLNQRTDAGLYLSPQGLTSCSRCISSSVKARSHPPVFPCSA